MRTFRIHLTVICWSNKICQAIFCSTILNMSRSSKFELSASLRWLITIVIYYSISGGRYRRASSRSVRPVKILSINGLQNEKRAANDQLRTKRALDSFLWQFFEFMESLWTSKFGAHKGLVKHSKMQIFQFQMSKTMHSEQRSRLNRRLPDKYHNARITRSTMTGPVYEGQTEQLIRFVKNWKLNCFLASRIIILRFRQQKDCSIYLNLDRQWMDPLGRWNFRWTLS